MFIIVLPYLDKIKLNVTCVGGNWQLVASGRQKIRMLRTSRTSTSTRCKTSRFFQPTCCLQDVFAFVHRPRLRAVKSVRFREKNRHVQEASTHNLNELRLAAVGALRLFPPALLMLCVIFPNCLDRRGIRRVRWDRPWSAIEADRLSDISVLGEIKRAG